MTDLIHVQVGANQHEVAKMKNYKDWLMKNFIVDFIKFSKFSQIAKCSIFKKNCENGEIFSTGM